MAKRHKHAGASATVTTTIDSARIADIAEVAAKQAETLQVMIRLEEAKSGRLVYSARNRVVGGRIEFMTFEVTLTEDNGVQHVRTKILNYKQKRQWIFIIPLPWHMMAWGNYKAFMYSLVRGVQAEDAGARTTVAELASA